jgi:serine/threonine-protein phosphatase PGAM5
VIARSWLVALLLLAPLAPARAQTAAPSAPGKALRTIVLVRHGVYDEDDARDPEVGKALIPLGREQARLTGERLAAWPQHIDVLRASTMTRARETAEIIGKELKMAPVPDRDLRECEPPAYAHQDSTRPSEAEKDACGARIDADFARYFRPSPDRDSTEVLVCHGNVIRWLTCRALKADPKLWLGMSLANCSLTVIQVRPDGTCKITAVGDRGHIPVEEQTWGMPRPAAAGARPGR